NNQKWTVIRKKALQNINEIKVAGFSGESTFENYTSPLLKTTRHPLFFWSAFFLLFFSRLFLLESS
ncbi:MAG: hypothetical protein WCP12_14615, partial [bacterium]